MLDQAVGSTRSAMSFPATISTNINMEVINTLVNEIGILLFEFELFLNDEIGSAW